MDDWARQAEPVVAFMLADSIAKQIFGHNYLRRAIYRDFLLLLWRDEGLF